MIGLDTNILLRLWLNDDPAQNKRVDKLLAEFGNTPGALMVTDVVLAEAIWTLKSVFEQNKAAQLLALRSLLDESAFGFENRAVVQRAMELFEQSTCGFSDCLIVTKNAQLGSGFTATFDRGMRSLPGAKLL